MQTISSSVEKYFTSERSEWMTKYAPMRYKIISLCLFKIEQRDAKVERVTSKEWKKYTAFSILKKNQL